MILNIIGMVDESISYMFRKFDKRFGSNTNPFNCWELLMGQSAAKTLFHKVRFNDYRNHKKRVEYKYGNGGYLYR